MTARAVALLVVVASGCTHTDLARNAPGHVDPRCPPRTPEERVPVDPGEQHVVIAYGAVGGLGAHVTGGAPGFAALAGPEVSVLYGRSATSHADPSWVIPSRAYGLRVGGVWATSNARHDDGARARPSAQIYGEAALRFERVIGAGAGWAVDVDGVGHGPQLTVSAGPLLLRGTHLQRGGTFVVLGVILSGQHAFVWSQ